MGRCEDDTQEIESRGGVADLLCTRYFPAIESRVAPTGVWEHCESQSIVPARLSTGVLGHEF